MAFSEPTKLITPTRITGLTRLTFDDPREAFWIGAIRFNRKGTDDAVKKKSIGEQVVVNGVRINTQVVGNPASVEIFDPTAGSINESMPDGLFYLKEKASGAHEITVDPAYLVTKADANWEFLPYRWRAGAVNLANFHGIWVNGHDNPIVVGRGTETGGDVRPIYSHMVPNNTVVVTGGNPTIASSVDAGASSTANFALRGVRSIALYNGSVVYGGFKTWNPKNVAGGVENFDHWIVFSDVIGSEYSAYSVDSSSALQIGADPSEPVVKVIINSVITDSLGVKGNLLVFTPRKVVFFDGIPPIPDDSLDSTFVSTLPPSPIGTWAQRAVVRTPYGVVFLGADGVTYIVPPTGWPVPIGRAMERQFKKLNPFQQQRSCAQYIDGHYVLQIPQPRGGRYNLTNMETWFADMRQFNLRNFDAGVQWTGPQDWPPLSVMATGRGQGDNLQVMGGSAVSSQIFEVYREDVKTNAPVRTDNPNGFSTVTALVKQKKIRIHGISNPLDLGDAHMDKKIDDVQIMLGTNNVSEFKVAISGIAVSEQSGALESNHEEFTETVQSSLGVLGGDTLILPPDEAVEPKTFQPGNRITGRMFVLEIREESAATADDETQPFFEDISMGVQPITRRG